MTFCVPHCGSDAECGAGLYCDQSTILGLCKKTRRTGDPIGTACTPGAATNTCKGGCLPTSADGVTPATGVCVELCSGGGGCLYGAGANPSPGGYCGGPLSDTFGVGDLGYCLSNCSCSSDCHAPNSLCRKWTNAETSLASALGAPGVCFPTLAGSVELSCGRGGAGGTGGTGGAGGSPQKAGAGGSP